MKDLSMPVRISRSRVSAVLLVLCLILSACNSGGTKPTEVKINAPIAGTAMNVGQGTVIQGEANGDNITRVEVVIDGKPYASLSTPDKAQGVPSFPVSVPWTPMSAGTHAVQLRAFGLDDKLLGQSEPLVMDAKAAVVDVTPTNPPEATVATSPADTGTSQAQATTVPTTAPQPTSATEGPKMTVTNDFVNVREGPNIGYRLLGRLDKGQSAAVRGKSQDGTWWQISYASGTNGVGWVFGEYVQANGAASSVSVASAPPLPTQPPVLEFPTSPPPTAVFIAPTPIPSQPTVGSQGQLHVSQNPIPLNGSVSAYWNVQGITGIWFDSGDGNGFQPAGGTQTVNLSGITGQRLFQLRWTLSNGSQVVDQLTLYISGQVAAYSTPVPVAQGCTSSDPNWRGGNASYPFCVARDLDWTDGGNPIRYFGTGANQDVSLAWNVYGVSGIWLSIQGNSQVCGPSGGSGRDVPVNGNATYTIHIPDFGTGGYIIHLKILRNDGQYVFYNEKFLCIGTGSSGGGSSATKTPAPSGNKTPTPQP